MMKPTNSSLIFIVSSILNESSYRQCDELVALASQAQNLCEYGVLGHIVQRLKQFELSPAQRETVNYFEGVLGIINGEPSAVYEIEQLASSGTVEIRSRAFHTLGFRAFRLRDAKAALGYYHESLRVFPGIDLLRALRIRKNIATCYAIDDDHQSAIRLLESLRPVAFSIRNISPTDYLDYLNSSAYELGCVGRFDEAESMSRIVIAAADPLKYPEWHDTPREIREMHPPRRSSVLRIRQPEPEKPQLTLAPPIADPQDEPDAHRSLLDIIHLAIVDEGISPLRASTTLMLIDRSVTKEDEIKTIRQGLDGLIQTRGKRPPKQKRKLKLVDGNM